MEEMRPLLNGRPVKSNFPNYVDGATCQPLGRRVSRRVEETESVNSLM